MRFGAGKYKVKEKG
jgi:hypothetical protein